MTTRRIERQSIAVAVAACLAGMPVLACAASPQGGNATAEDIGIVSGLALGAAAGGPVGAVIARGPQLEQTVAAVDEIGMDLSFRTDDTAIKVKDLPPLLKLGALAAAMPDAKVRIAGYADPRGPADYNDALSARRAAAVAAALERAGLPRARLIVEAHGSGESTSVAGDLDAYALDRRVRVRLERTAPVTSVAQTSARAGADPGMARP